MRSSVQGHASKGAEHLEFDRPRSLSEIAHRTFDHPGPQLVLQSSQLGLELRYFQPPVGGPLRNSRSPGRVLDRHTSSKRHLQRQFLAPDSAARRRPGSHLLNSAAVPEGAIEKVTRNRIQGDETDRSCFECGVINRSRCGVRKHNHRDGLVDGSNRVDNSDGRVGLDAVVNEQGVEEPIAKSSETTLGIARGDDLMIEPHEEFGECLRTGPILCDEQDIHEASIIRRLELT